MHNVDQREKNKALPLYLQVLNTTCRLIQKFEGFSSEPYVDAAGYLTIGYGRRISPQDANVETIITTEWEELSFLIQEIARINKILDEDLINIEDSQVSDGVDPKSSKVKKVSLKN